MGSSSSSSNNNNNNNMQYQVNPRVEANLQQALARESNRRLEISTIEVGAALTVADA
jgi:hypothetical protein